MRQWKAVLFFRGRFKDIFGFFGVVFVFYLIKISNFALPGVMLMYERTSIDRKKRKKKNDRRGQKFHTSPRNFKWNLERMSYSSQCTHPVGQSVQDFLSIFTGSLILEHYTRECEFGNFDKIKKTRTTQKTKQHKNFWLVLSKELLEVVWHITHLCSLLHKQLMDMCMCLQDEWKLSCRTSAIFKYFCPLDRDNSVLGRFL